MSGDLGMPGCPPGEPTGGTSGFLSWMSRICRLCSELRTEPEWCGSGSAASVLLVFPPDAVKTGLIRYKELRKGRPSTEFLDS